jgi:cell wall-associated NlpC family hydrolase
MALRRVRHGAALTATLALLLAGCAGAPRPAPPPRAPTGEAIASAAVALIGTPYAFGGADEGGFDCSGLALYAHERVGLAIPRTAAAQQRAARPVPLAQLRPGDLLFFRLGSRGIDHVGIYAGDRRFIHAPHRGLAVTAVALDDPYFAHHLVNAGRFWDGVLTGP